MAQSDEISSVQREESGETSNKDAWLVNLMKIDSSDKSGDIKPRIQRVPQLLREIEDHETCFVPRVASIGPYYHGKPEFEMIEKIKPAFARRFASDCGKKIEDLYKKVVDVAAEARKYYADGSTTHFDKEEFNHIMFLDGCFVLNYIYCVVNNNYNDEMLTCRHVEHYLLRDLFLLENQLPYVVLMELMSLRSPGEEKGEKIHDFINTMIDKTEHRSKGHPGDQQPLHLLHLFRTKLLGGNGKPHQSQLNYGIWQTFGTVKELKAVGIRFRQSRTSFLNDIHFRSYKFYGELSLPPLFITRITKDVVLNFIAYEMCPDAPFDCAVSTYIYFLNMLIDGADDVKELRSKGILYNGLGSDEEVVDLLKQLSIGLVIDLSIYHHIIIGIELYYRNKAKVSIGEIMHTHFSSPWTAIAFLAAIFIIALSIVQTYFAVFPR